MCWLAPLCLPCGTSPRPHASSATFLSWEGTAPPVGDRLMGQQTTRRVPLRGYYSCRSDKLSGEIIPTKLKYPSVPISLLIRHSAEIMSSFIRLAFWLQFLNT